MALFGRITESAAATKTFATLRIDRRVLMTPARTIVLANVSTIGVGTHIAPKPRLFFWLLALVFALMALGSMRPDLSLGPLAPTGISVVLGVLTLVFAGLAIKPDDKTQYLLISSNDGVLSRFTAPDRAVLDEVRSILTDKINRGDESMTFSVNFEKGQIENLIGGGGGNSPSHHVNGSGHAAAFGDGAATPQDRSTAPVAGGRSPVARSSRGVQPGLSSGQSGGGAPPEIFVDFSTVLPAIVEMHRFYARQPGTQHLEQRLSELELLMRAGAPTLSQKGRLRELARDMSQILQAYPQAVELFDHIGGLVV